MQSAKILIILALLFFVREMLTRLRWWLNGIQADLLLIGLGAIRYLRDFRNAI